MSRTQSLFHVITPEFRHKAPRAQVQGLHLVLGLQTVQAPNVQWIERNTTLYQCPGTSARALSVNTALVSFNLRSIFLLFF